MADDTVKKLLIKLGISTQDWKTAVNDIKRQLDTVNQKAKADAAEMKATQKEQLNLTKQQIADQQRLAAEAKALAEFDKAKVAWMKKQQEASKQQIVQKQLETVELKKQTVEHQAQIKFEQEKVRLAQMQLRLQQQQESAARRASAIASPGVFGSIGRMFSGLTGGGMMGAMVGGAFLGTGFEHVFEMLIGKVRELGHALVDATGPEVQLRTEFERLASGKGVDPSATFDKMRRATRGLVEDVNLLKITNNFLRSDMKISTDQMVKLVTTTFDLGRGMKKSSEEIQRALEIAFLNPQRGMMTLARVTGISVTNLRNAMVGLGRGVDPATRATIMFNHVLAEEEKMLKKVGVPATTLPELFKQIHVAGSEFVDEMARGILHGTGFGRTIEEISKKLLDLGPKLEKTAEALGEKIGEGIKWLADHGDDIIHVLEGIVAIKVADWAVGAAAGVVELTTAFKGLAAAEVLEGLGGALPGVGKLGKVLRGPATTVEEGTAAAGGAAAGRVIGGAVGSIAATVVAVLGTAAVIGAIIELLDKLTPEAKEGLHRDTFGRVIGPHGLPYPGAGLTPAQMAAQAQLDTFVGGTTHGGPLAEQHPTGGGVSTPTGPDIATLRKIQDEKTKLMQLGYKMDLEDLKLNIERKQELLRKDYDLGNLMLQAYIKQQKELKEQLFVSTVDELQREEKAQEDNIKKRSKVVIDGQEYEVENAELKKLALEKLHASTQLKIKTLTLQHTKEMNGLTEQGLKDEEAARLKHESNLTAVAKQGVQERTAIIEKEFQSGRMGAEAYLVLRRQLQNVEFGIAMRGYEERLKSAKTLAEQETIEGEKRSAIAAHDKETAMDEITADDVRLKGLEKRFSLEEKLLTIQSSTARMMRGMGPTNELAIQNRLIDLTQQYINNLVAALQHEDAGSQKWFEITDEIAKANQKILQYKENAAALKDISGPMATGFGAVAGVAGAIPGGQRVAEFASKLEAASKALSQFSQAVHMAGGSKGLFHDIGQNFLGLFGKGKGGKQQTENQQLIAKISDNIKALQENTNALTGKGGEGEGGGDAESQGKGGKPSFTDSLGGLMGGISKLAGGIQGLVQGLTSGQSGGEGALGGGMAGMQFGMSVGGPIGAAIGLVGGGIMGGIFGAKEKQLQQDLHKIQTQMQSIVEDLRTGTISLSQALADLRRERQSALQMLAQDPKGGKGGGKGGKKGYTPSQAQAAIEAIDQQIQQLVDQQTTILRNLHESLMELSQPIQFQDYIQSLDTIIQKYEEFASAAQGNAQEVANANQFLNLSLQNYVTTLSQNLNQAQQQAIQDALTLIDLEYQRQQLINQEAQQEYDIMSQGVLTRQRTTAMTKGQEIGVLRYQRDMQLQQMNEQIALDQHKVDAETKIFGLASTRIGLETQLLAAQEEQADYQVAQVQALAKVLAALQSGLSGGQLMQQITALMGTGAMPTGPGILYTLLQELGLGGNVPPGAVSGQYGITNWLAKVPSTYASAAQFVASLDPDFVNMIMSGQYKNAASVASQYASQGEVEGFDMNGFISWLQAGGQYPTNTGTGTRGPGGKPGPGYPYGTPNADVGAYVERSGIASLKRGEQVLPESIVRLLNTSSSGINIVGEQQVSVESSINKMTKARSDMEFSVLRAKASMLDLEQQHLLDLNAFYDRLQSINNTSAGNLEAMLQKVYETRGRYGSAQFRRETL